MFRKNKVFEKPIYPTRRAQVID